MLSSNNHTDILLLISSFFGNAAFASPVDLSNDLTLLGITDLMNLEITSVAKKSQKLLNAAAAVYVITQEDIRLSGATSIPDALRMAPGLHVARIDANKWAITSRGFNSIFRIALTG
jgi:iron complex outermembrane recepter protein